MGAIVLITLTRIELGVGWKRYLAAPDDACRERGEDHEPERADDPHDPLGVSLLR